MSTRAEQMKAKAARAAERKQQSAAEQPASAPTRTSAPAAPHAKPVRSTVDLMPDVHAQLANWRGQVAIEIGRSRVTTQDVLRALVDRLLTDEQLAQTITDELRNKER